MRARLVLASLWFLAACSSTAPSEEGLRLATEGTRFEAGGPITVELSNQSGVEVGYNFCQRFWERKVGMQWERFEEMILCAPAFAKLPTGEIAEETLGVPYGLVPGTWRVSAAVLVGDESEPILSNEFVIELGEQR